MSISVASFYRFTPLADPALLRKQVTALCRHHDMRGTVLLAQEGLNGTLAGRPDALTAVLRAIGAAIGGSAIQATRSNCDVMPFERLKVRLKREIVTMGVPSVAPDQRTGTFVPPADWNALLADPAIPVIDVRNGFEHAIGSFAGAIDPGTAHFSDFPGFAADRLDPARHAAVAMFCTGGIRCEKASSLLLERGFETVYQLEGGILAYLDQVPEAESLWRGSCFVFDGRIALGHGLRAEPRRLCGACSMPLPDAASGPRCAACVAADGVG